LDGGDTVLEVGVNGDGLAYFGIILTGENDRDGS
jgi:hypothetical protein